MLVGTWCDIIYPLRLLLVNITFVLLNNCDYSIQMVYVGSTEI